VDTYDLLSRVSVYGGFAGGETAVRQRNIGGNVTILHGLDSADSVICGQSATDARLDGITVTGGQGRGYGGGVWLQGQNVTLANCVFRNNTAGDDGAGVHIRGNSTVTIKRCVFRNNTASHNAGGLDVVLGADVVVQDSLFYANVADGLGGAAWVDGSDPLSSLTVINCTIVSNTGTNGGGAFRNDEGTLTVINSILWGNSTNEIDLNGGTTTVSYSNVQGGFSGTQNSPAGPLFVDFGLANFRLLAGSPCIDSANGNPASLWDILGQARVDAPPANTGIGTPPFVDRGAYEYQIP